MSRFARRAWPFLVLLYVVLFLVVHAGSSFRRPAANLAYWHYSDLPVLEALEFWAFWPLRQVAYRIPGGLPRHNRERIPWAAPEGEEGA